MASRKSESLPPSIEGALVVPKGASFAIVASRFNDFIVQSLVAGARDALVRHGADASAITVVRVPGAWELGPTCARLARSKRGFRNASENSAKHGRCSADFESWRSVKTT